MHRAVKTKVKLRKLLSVGVVMCAEASRRGKLLTVVQRCRRPTVKCSIRQQQPDRVDIKLTGVDMFHFFVHYASPLPAPASIYFYITDLLRAVVVCALFKQTEPCRAAELISNSFWATVTSNGSLCVVGPFCLSCL